MAIPIDQLINSGALTYAQTQLSRGHSPSETLSRLRRRYPSQPQADLQYLIDIAIMEETIQQEMLHGDPNRFFGPDLVPLIPGRDPNTYEVDVSYTLGGGRTVAGKRGFFRLIIDSIDILIGLLFAGESVISPRQATFPDLRETLADVQGGENILDIIRTHPDALTPGQIEQIGAAAEPFPPRPTRAALEQILSRVPADEPERIVFPANWRLYEKQRKILEAKVLFLGRG